MHARQPEVGTTCAGVAEERDVHILHRGGLPLRPRAARLGASGAEAAAASNIIDLAPLLPTPAGLRPFCSRRLLFLLAMRRSQLRSGPNDRDRRQGQGTGLGDSSVVGDKLSSRCTALSRSSCRSRLAAVLALAEPNAAQNSTSICLCYAVIFLSL